MFDATTTGLIKAAPPFSALETGKIPQELTAVYAELVALRLSETPAGKDPRWLDRKKQLSRVAAFYEAVVDDGTEGDVSRAAAFVAGSAHQLLHRLSEANGHASQKSLFDDGSIDSLLASPLLFLIAEQNPDAREAARALKSTTATDRLSAALVESIYDLATERFNSLMDRGDRLSRLKPSDDISQSLSGAQALYGLCLAGIFQMVARLLGRAPPETPFKTGNTPQETFQTATRLATHRFDLPRDHTTFTSAFTGPRHLARLLRKVADGLEGSSIIDLEPPAGADSKFWNSWLRHRASTKPILWRNHRSAIATGFLDCGRSAVLVLPTGAGKTTLSELKIAATLASNRKVVFLVPTLALVDQLKDELADSFPTTLGGVEISGDGDLFGLTVSNELKSIEVMTPERCLALFGHAPEALDEVGLVIFDECHLLSPSGGGSRSLDAMLCLLQVLLRAPQADLLMLSAMLTNAEEFAAWIQEFTGRQCESFNDPWKPSRQARGVVIYQRSDVDRIVQQRRQAGSGKKSSARNKPASTAIPFALFGLQQNWAADSPADRKLVQLSASPITLSVSEFGHLTPNANSVAADLAIHAAKSHLKTIVFVQQASYAASRARDIAAALPTTSELSESEQRLWVAVQDELGGTSYCLFQPNWAALPHNGDMFAVERRLAESIFRRPSGANVIVATPTLSQGMNLPAQLVILAGDKRYDPEGRSSMESHEILNAAGRAGRAGHLANGAVLMIPEPVVSFSREGPELKALEKLRTLLPVNDQCVEIADPISALLDRIQQGLSDDTRINYFISRVQSASPTEEVGEQATAAVSRSFGAYLARKNGRAHEFNEKLESLRQALAAASLSRDPDVAAIAASNGISQQVLICVKKKIEASGAALPATVVQWLDWIVDFLAGDREAYDLLLGPDAGVVLYVVRGKKTGGGPTYDEFNRLKSAMRAWLSGRPVCEIEIALGVNRDKLGTCPRARDFVLKLANRTFYVFTAAVAEVARIVCSKHDFPCQPAVLDTLAIALRKGFDSPYKVAFSNVGDRQLSRVQTHLKFASIFRSLPPLGEENYESVRGYVTAVLALIR